MPISTVSRILTFAICNFVFASSALATTVKQCTANMPYLGPPALELIVPGDREKVKALAADMEDGLKEAREKRLDRLFTEIQAKADIPSITVAVAERQGEIWSRTIGLNGSQRLHYWASAGKTFTAVIIMQLVENGDLDLSDTLDQWVENVPHGHLITVEMLLNHSAGLISANEDPAAKHIEGPMSLAQQLEILNRRGALFCPGQYWRYSNSGYYFLGKIAEKITGQSLADIIGDRIVEPLNLFDTRILSADDNITDIAPPRSGGDKVPDVRGPGAAGPVAASASDMARFWRGLLDGKLVSDKSWQRMIAKLYPMFDDGSYYGLGVMAIKAPSENANQPTYWIGHGGGMPGIKAFVLADPITGNVAAAAVTGDAPASAIAYQMLKEWQIVTD